MPKFLQWLAVTLRIKSNASLPSTPRSSMSWSLTTSSDFLVPLSLLQFPRWPSFSLFKCYHLPASEPLSLLLLLDVLSPLYSLVGLSNLSGFKFSHLLILYNYRSSHPCPQLLFWIIALHLFLSKTLITTIVFRFLFIVHLSIDSKLYNSLS